MKDIFHPIRKAYYTALAGNITHNGQPVPVYDAIPLKAGYPYVLFAQQNANPVTNKRGCEQYDTAILVEIITGYFGVQGGKKDADMIADQILTLLTPPLPNIPGLDVGLCYLDSDFDQGREMTDTSTINRRLIRFSNTVNL